MKYQKQSPPSSSLARIRRSRPDPAKNTGLPSYTRYASACVTWHDMTLCTVCHDCYRVWFHIFDSIFLIFLNWVNWPPANKSSPNINFCTYFSAKSGRLVVGRETAVVSTGSKFLRSDGVAARETTLAGISFILPICWSCGCFGYRPGCSRLTGT